MRWRRPSHDRARTPSGRRSEGALLRAQVAAAPLGLAATTERRARAATAALAEAAEVAGGPGGAGLCGVDAERAAAQLVTVETLDGRGGLGVAAVLDEGEATRA